MSDQLIQDSQEKIEAMEAKIAELEAQLREHAEMIEEKVEDDAEETRATIKKDVARFYKELYPLIDKYKAGREEIIKKVSYNVCEHPGVAMALAFGAGLLFAKLLEDKIERCEHHHHHL